VKVQQELGDAVGRDVHIYSITLDPADTPERLRAYAEGYGAGEGWTFLTGDPGEIDHLRHRLGAFDPDPVVDADKTQHSGLLIFGNEPRGQWCAVPGLLPPAAIARIVRRTMRPIVPQGSR